MSIVSKIAVIISLLITSLSAFAFKVEVAYSPANDLPFTLKAIQHTKKSILMNIYDLRSPEVAEALVTQIKAGTQINILSEGQTTEELQSAALHKQLLGLHQQIADVMKSENGDHFYSIFKEPRSARRYTFDHGKYMVLDDEALFIGSDNYWVSEPRLTGTSDRGWIVKITDSSLAKIFTKNLKNHFVICGWNDDMVELIHHMLDFNPKMTSKEIVVLANIPTAMIETLKTDLKLKDLQIIVGDHFTAVNLKRAAPERARKILILGDRTAGHNGLPPTATEVDARTIMTAMTLANMARGTLVTAEILDPKMDHYLKLAGVSEIIYSSEYSRLILGNASSGTGLANIVHDLLDPKTHAVMTTIPIPENFIGTEYGRLKYIIEKADKHYLVIGLLENSGNSHQIKETALKRAQKTPNVTELVRNLHEVKELRCNHPIIHPNATFLIKEGSMAIVIENRAERSHDVAGTEKAAA